MSRLHQTKLVHVDEYVAEVEIELIVSDDEWSPYLSVEDALRLDQVREALRKRDFSKAANLARVYRLTPITA